MAIIVPSYIFLDSERLHGKMSTNIKCPLISGHLGAMDIN
jgi:hypothetical protein